MYVNVKEKDRDKEFGSMHIDYDRNEKVFYNNIYFKKYNLVIKMSLFKEEKTPPPDDVIIERFDITKYIYLAHY